MKAPALTAVLAFVLAGCTSAPAPETGPWHGRDLDPATWNQWDLKPCQIIELDFRFDETTLFAWDWVSDNRVHLQFDLHTHAGEEVVILQSISADQHAGQWTMEAGQTYSLIWTNHQSETAGLWHQHPAWLRGTLGALPESTCAPEAMAL